MTDVRRPVRALARLRGPVAVVVLALAVACTPSADRASQTAPGDALDAPGAVSSTSAVPEVGSASTMARPNPALTALAGRARADVFVVAEKGLAVDRVAALRALSPGGFTTVRVGHVTFGGRRYRAVGVNAASFRAFTPKGTAEATGVWQAVARGDVIIAHAEAKSLQLPLGKSLEVRGAQQSLPLRLGALATTGLPDMVAVVNDRVASQLGMTAASGAILGAGRGDPVQLAAAVRKAAGPGVRVDLLTQPAPPTAFLTGSRAAREFGAFSYRYHDDGTIEPDNRWVTKNIRYSRLPLIGLVRCHRLTIPQLRRALMDIEAAGLGAEIRSYSGCYVPRFIERNPTRSVSLHTWGIAFDINVTTNQLGTVGDMDPRVVAIFERWGFRWGGRWEIPDPMHFELAALLNV
ncbi:MAG TPA: M15 family metallopeptidase [Mycobacteriales bacterium]|nr:M15 family metallopeptidase [Mycobacteriales bacterium]